MYVVFIIIIIIICKTLFMKHPRFTLFHTNLYIAQLK